MNDDTQREDSTTALEMTRRLEAIENRIAFQEHWLDTLDAGVAAQERRLMQLERLNALMQERLRDQQRALPDGDAAAPHPEDEVPPHY